MKRAVTVFLYIVLLAVVASSAQTVWIAFADRARYNAVFPGARGPAFWLTVATSSLAGLNALFIALGKRWAVLINPAIGLASVGLVELVGGPRSSQVVIVVACTASTVLPWLLWRRAPDEFEGIRRFVGDPTRRGWW